MTSSATMKRPASASGARPAPPEQQPRRRRGVTLVLALIALVALAAAGAVVWFSPVLTARQVRVTGVRTLSVAQVLGTAHVPLGRPLARLSTQAVADRVAALPPVRSARVSRSWPDTVKIVVTERTAVLAVRRSAGYVLVDDQGAAYLTVASSPASVLLAEVDPANTQLLTRLGIVAQALPAQLRAQVSSVAATTPDGIGLKLRGGNTVFWGSADQSAVKAEVLLALLKHRANSYDVSAPQSPAVH